MVYDTGAPDGTPSYVRGLLSEAEARRPASLAMSDETLAVVAADGTMWLGRALRGGWCWQRLPDLPLGELEPILDTSHQEPGR